MTAYLDLAELCALGARLYGDSCALKNQSQCLSYEQLNAHRLAFASYLMKQGVAPGDRVLLVVENSLEYVIAYFGVLTAGASASEPRHDGLASPIDGKRLPREAAYLSHANIAPAGARANGSPPGPFAFLIC